MLNKHIEIARSSEIELSSMSQESLDAILAVLTKHYASVGVSIVNTLADLEALVDKQPDLVFLGLKFIPMHPGLGQRDPARIWVSKYLDERGIAYTGSNQMAHELELNKPLAKQRALDEGLKTAPFYVAKQTVQQLRNYLPLPFPLFIKPTNRGGGLGVDGASVVHNFDQMQAKVLSIWTNHQSDSLIEEYLPGREFSVAILKDEDSDEFSVMPIELIAPADEQGARLLSDQVKTANAEQVLKVTDKILMSKITQLALNVFHALGARDYGRIDIRLDKEGTPHFLEANLLPSLISGYGSFPKACVLNIGLDYEKMILSIVRLAMARSLDVTEDTPEFDNVIDVVLPALEPILET